MLLYFIFIFYTDLMPAVSSGALALGQFFVSVPAGGFDNL